jgi:tetratricopeptide (TPR) repeat protein
MLTNAYMGMGLLRKASEASRRAIELYERAGDLSGQAAAHTNLASCHQLLGELREALYHDEVALAIDQRLRYVSGVAIGHNNIAEVLLLMGQTQEAIEHLGQVIARRDMHEVPQGLLGFALVNLAKAYLRLGRLDEARSALEEGRVYLEKAEAHGVLGEAHRVHVELCLASGRVDEALAACQSLLASARAMGAELDEAQGLRLLGQVHMGRGDHRAAREHLERSVDLVRQIGAEYELGLALLSLAELYSAGRSRDRDARGAIDEAIVLLERAGAARELEWARTLEAGLTKV